jgi:CRP-like cAMP-binding protein
MGNFFTGVLNIQLVKEYFQISKLETLA